MAQDACRTLNGNISVEDPQALRRMEDFMRLVIAKDLSRFISFFLCDLAIFMVMLKIVLALLKWRITFFSGGRASDHQ